MSGRNHGADWFKLGTAVNVKYVDNPIPVGTKRLSPLAGSLRQSLRLLQDLCQSPTSLVSISYTIGWFHGQAHAESKQRAEPIILDDVTSIRERAYDLLSVAIKTIGGENFLKTIANIERQLLHSLAEDDDSNFSVALSGAKIGILTWAWTIFESLASDLLVEAMNHDAKLVTCYVDPKRGALTGHDEDGVHAKHIGIDLLHRYGYDLRGKMGTLLVDTNKLQLDSLKKLKKTYNDAFGAGFFENSVPNLEQIEFIEAVRNLYSHRAGLVDQKFLKRVKRHPELSRLEEGRFYEVPTLALREFVAILTESSISLLKAVDARLDVTVSE